MWVVVVVVAALVAAVSAAATAQPGDVGEGGKEVCVRPPRLAHRDNPMVILHSFPGAGNTWMRTLIEQLTGACTGSVYDDNDLRKLARRDESAGMACEGIRDGSVAAIKSHNNMMLPRKQMGGAIILFRDPAAAIVAEYSRLHSAAHDGLPPASIFRGSNFARFMRMMSLRYADGYMRQCLDFSHTKGNGTERVACTSFALLWMSYEDMKQRPRDELTRLGDFLHEVRPLHKQAADHSSDGGNAGATNAGGDGDSISSKGKHAFSINVTCALRTPSRKGIKRQKPAGYSTVHEIMAPYGDEPNFVRAQRVYEDMLAFARKQQRKGHWNVYNASVQTSRLAASPLDLQVQPVSLAALLPAFSSSDHVFALAESGKRAGQPWVDAWGPTAATRPVILVLDRVTGQKRVGSNPTGRARAEDREEAGGGEDREDEKEVRGETTALRTMFRAIRELHSVGTPVHVVMDSARLVFKGETITGNVLKTLKLLETQDVLRLHPCHSSNLNACTRALQKTLEPAVVTLLSSFATHRPHQQKSRAEVAGERVSLRQLNSPTCVSVLSMFVKDAGRSCAYMSASSNANRIAP